MKKTIIMFVVMVTLILASTTNAALFITVDGIVNPSNGIIMNPNDTANIGITGIGNGAGQLQLYLFMEGNGSFTSASATILAGGNLSSISDLTQDEIADFNNNVFGNTNYHSGIFISILDDSTQLSRDGLLIDAIDYRHEGNGEVVIDLFRAANGAPIIFQDNQTFIPEPMSLSFLVMGSVVLCRNRKNKY